jgi:hypothetical protein
MTRVCARALQRFVKGADDRYHYKWQEDGMRLFDASAEVSEYEAGGRIYALPKEVKATRKRKVKVRTQRASECVCGMMLVFAGYRGE